MYRVVTEVALEDLEAQVNRLLGEGWQPLGGVATFMLGPSQHFAQALLTFVPEQPTDQEEPPEDLPAQAGVATESDQPGPRLMMPGGGDGAV